MKSFWFKYPNVIYELEKEPSLILQNLSISESGQMGSFAAQSRLVCFCSSSWWLGIKPRDLSQAEKKKLLSKLSKYQVSQQLRRGSIESCLSWSFGQNLEGKQCLLNIGDITMSITITGKTRYKLGPILFSQIEINHVIQQTTANCLKR